MKKLLTSIFLIILPHIAFCEEIAVISKYIPSETLTKKTVAKIFLGRKVLWEDGKKIIPVNLPSQNPIRVFFSKKILKKDHRELVKYWNEQYFKGISPPMVLESEEAVKKYVKEVDGAIGYISINNIEPDLHVLFTIEME